MNDIEQKMKKVNKQLIGYMVAMLVSSGMCASCTEEDFSKGENGGSTPYITKVLEYFPAPGQFVNTLPEYEEGDTQETMNRKVLDAIGHNNRVMISLGGYGGYVTVGFDHTIENKKGLCDFRVLGNAFVSNGSSETRKGDGSCEPGIIMVAYDANHNGKPDAEEWYEIAGSAHKGPESWSQELEEAGMDVTLYKNYTMTYYRPENDAEESIDEYIRWEANQGKVKSGYRAKNVFHRQSYFPLWINEDKLTFTGTCLPQNGLNKGTDKDYFILHCFKYGYADNVTNASPESAIDIDWAVDNEGNYVNLPGVDFIRIYTGVNQENGWLGECSTEVTGVEDLHLLGEKIKL